MTERRAPRTRGRRGDGGFTLIELLVVVTIIGILAAIVSVSVSGFTGTAQKNKKQSDVASVQGAVDAWIALKTTGNLLNVPRKVAGGAAQTTAITTSGDAAGWFDKNGLDVTLQTVAGANVYQEVDITALVTEGLLRLRASPGTFKCVFMPPLQSLAVSGEGGQIHTSNTVGACKE